MGEAGHPPTPGCQEGTQSRKPGQEGRLAHTQEAARLRADRGKEALWVPMGPARALNLAGTSRKGRWAWPCAPGSLQLTFFPLFFPPSNNQPLKRLVLRKGGDVRLQGTRQRLCPPREGERQAGAELWGGVQRSGREGAPGWLWAGWHCRPSLRDTELVPHRLAGLDLVMGF